MAVILTLMAFTGTPWPIPLVAQAQTVGLIADPVPPATTFLVGTEPDGGFGTGVGRAGDVNGDGFADLLVGSPFARTNRGRVELYLGSPVGLQPKPAWSLEGREVGENLGLVISGIGDINGDRFADFMVSRVNVASTNGPRTWVELYLGGASGPVATAWRFEHVHPGFYIGGKAGPAGDVNGDGVEDVYVGAHMFRSPPDGKSNGTVFVFHGSTNGLSTTPDWSCKGPISGDGFGVAIAGAGDVNGDGFADLVVGAPLDDQSGHDAGRVYLFHGSRQGLSPMPNWSSHSPLAIRDAYSTDQEGYFGCAVASAGDVNGDGFADIIVGAHFAEQSDTNEGVAFLFLGSSTGLQRKPQWMGQANQPFANFGIALDGGGDINGDGFADILVGAPHASNDQQQEGLAAVWMGSRRGLRSDPDWTAETDRTEDYLGEHVAFLGDVNNDGFDDVAISGTGFRENDEFKGRVLVKYGSKQGLTGSSNWRLSKPWTFAAQQWWDRSKPQSRYLAGATLLACVGLGTGVTLRWLRRHDARVASEGRHTAFIEAARDLHDEVGPFVTTLGAIAAEAGTSSQDTQATLLAHRLEAPLTDLGETLDHLVWRWRSDGTDLRRTVEWMFKGAARIADPAGLKVVIEMGTLQGDGTLPEGSIQHLQPCLREAVTNVVKHANASTVFLRAAMSNPSNLRLEVEDDGQGMSAAAGGGPGQDGLQNLTSRLRQIGGRCEIAAEPNRGVLVCFEIPLVNPTPNV